MKFELNNHQRKYLGLEIVPDNWEKVEITKEIFVYFDGNTIRKKISVGDYSYQEIKLEEETVNRTILLPKTSRGKEKKLNFSSLEARNGIGMYFTFNIAGIIIGNHSTEKTYYSTSFENIRFKSIKDLPLWLDNYISNTTESDLNDLQKIATEERKRINLKEGDFFIYKVDRRNFGFGRLICDIRKIRKNPNFKTNKNYGFSNLMTQPLVIKIYHIIQNSKEIDLTYLKFLKSLPSQYIMDNLLYYGDFEIIGNLPLEDWEIDFPISYARSISYGDFDTVYLQYGKIYKETKRDKFYKYIEIPNPDPKGDWDKCLKFNPYRNESIQFGLDFNKSSLLQAISENSNQSYWNEEFYGRDTDLRNPINREIKKEIFDFFELDSNKLYSENLQKNEW
ncbi:immunity 26/phosphotriesterase HocA family protein [Flavobacterium lipolyticum]|uniref:Immunity 26/phosphotriesterase HocA family protein n=1 Tax=Flavobacterium lipolyticum TaxID=2893754 RepID=A0ABS8M1M7_9FLAO|nr:immunity 26/phosphotriesterase HocA family protein [Flavobacterium sp. F-126]MCC9018746.1 immunity 26/phosphotriesterase HocA family protein [Flavobacterium sp. F-126]